MPLIRLNTGKGVLAEGDTLPRNKRGQPVIKVFRPSKLKRDNGKLVEVELPYTRMTTYIDALDDKKNLHDYGKRAALLGGAILFEDDKFRREVATMDLDNPQHRKPLNAHAEKALAKAGANRKRDRGSVLHKLSEYVDRGEPYPETVMVDGREIPVTEDDILDMHAYRLATRDAGLQLTKLIERPTVLDELKIAGTPDRIGFYEGLDPDGLPAGHLIGDLKTGHKAMTFDPVTGAVEAGFGVLKMAMQLAGYSRSKFYSPETGQRDDLPDDLNLRWGVIINLPSGSGVCKVAWIDLTIGWTALQLATEVRAMRNQGRKVLRSFGGDSSQPLATVDEEEGDA